MVRINGMGDQIVIYLGNEILNRKEQEEFLIIQKVVEINIEWEKSNMKRAQVL